MNKPKIITATILAIFGTFFAAHSVNALSEDLMSIYSANNILFYDPDNCMAGGADVSVCGTTLPEETIKALESADVKGKANQNMERYKYAEQQTGIPWQAIAALHWREATMNPSSSIYNGQKLTSDGSCYSNVDKRKICSDSREDAANAARALIGNAKNTYGVDLLSDKSMEAYGKAFLAYNRGGLYKCKDVSYLDSPYVMNGFDKQHLNMTWLDVDTYNFCDNIDIKNYISPGSKDGKVGALAVMAYLCGGDSSPSSESLSKDSSDIQSADTETDSSIDTADGTENQASFTKGCATYEGDYPEYIQEEGPWASIAYGGSTISKSGCGAASMAMLVTYVTGQDIFPQDVASITNSSPYFDTSGVGMADLDKKVCEIYGCEVEIVPYSSKQDALQKLQKYLEEGYVIHLSGAGKRPYSTKGHYIGLAGYNNGNTMVLNSSFGGNKEYSLIDVIKNGMHGNAFSAIRGSKSGSGKCAGLCSLGSAIDSEGGLDKEQAKKLADYYNGDEVSVATYSLPYGKKNCVSFSAFFVQHFTDVGIIKGGYAWTTEASGYGAKSMVSVLKNNLRFQTGTGVKPFSVFSVASGSTMCGKTPCGHTGVVVGVHGDDVITIEASYPDHDAAVYVHKKDFFSNSIDDPFAYADSRSFNKTEMAKIVGN